MKERKRLLPPVSREIHDRSSRSEKYKISSNLPPISQGGPARDVEGSRISPGRKVKHTFREKVGGPKKKRAVSEGRSQGSSFFLGKKKVAHGQENPHHLPMESWIRERFFGHWK